MSKKQIIIAGALVIAAGVIAYLLQPKEPDIPRAERPAGDIIGIPDVAPTVRDTSPISRNTTKGLGQPREFFVQSFKPMEFKKVPQQDGSEAWFGNTDDAQVELYGPAENIKSFGVQRFISKTEPQVLESITNGIQAIMDVFNPTLKSWAANAIAELYANRQQHKIQQFDNLTLTVGLTEEEGGILIYGVYFEGP